jgi:PAS domain-containing protein
MSKFSPEEAARILADAYAHLTPRDHAVPTDLPAEEVAYEPPPAEDRVAKWKREADEQEERFARERERQERAEIAANAPAVQRIADLEAEVLEVARATGTVCEALENELAHVTRENTELKTRQAQLEAALADLRLAVTERSDRKAMLDLPNPLSSVNRSACRLWGVEQKTYLCPLVHYQHRHASVG